MRRVLSLLLLAAACGGSALPDRVAVLGVDRLSGALAGQEVELPGTDLAAVRGPAAMIMLGSSTDTARVPDCAMRRRVSGALVARTVSCVSLLGHYAAMERARQFLLAAGAEALLPAPVLASSTAEPGLHYDARTDTFTLGAGPEGARGPCWRGARGGGAAGAVGVRAGRGAVVGRGAVGGRGGGRGVRRVPRAAARAGHSRLSLRIRRSDGRERSPRDASAARAVPARRRSEEHTSELQSRPHLVCRLLLEKKKKK